MDFDEYQKKASEYDLSEATTDLKAVGFIEKVLGLVGEAGETADKIKKILRDKDGVVSDRTEIWLTHIGHKGGLNHTELQQKMRSLVGPQIDVAYDGLRLADF